MTDTQGKTKQLGLAVIGGGLTGKMMALTLAQCGEPVVLFAPSVPAGRVDRRSTTIHEAGRKMLDALGVLGLPARNNDTDYWYFSGGWC